MNDFCRAGGVPGVGIHTHVWGVAILDVLGTILGAFILGKMLGREPFMIFVVLMIIGTLMHMSCGINTTLTNFIGYKY